MVMMTEDRDIVDALETILERPLLVSADDLDRLPERDPEAFRILQDIAKVACRFWPAGEEGAR